jgi:quinol monooxygenase YgiN
VGGLTAVDARRAQSKDETVKTDKPAARLLRHVVMFKFKADATKEQIKGIEEAFAALPSRIDVIHDFEWGTDNSPEMLAKGFTHCFLVTFKDEEARKAYLPHAAHQEFVSKVKPVVEDVMVIDYWTPGEASKAK